MAVTKITGAGLGLPNADGNALGGTSNEWSDLYLADGGILYLGNDQDVTLTHVADTGVLLNSSRKIQFGDSATFIHQSSDGVMTVDGEATIDLNASTAVLVSNDLKLNSDSAVLGFGADNDVTLTHAADTSLTCNLMVAATTFEPSADTSSGDNAAIGYTSAEGLILTGQGSTDDVTIKNDADAAVIAVPTGTTNVDVVGDVAADSFNLPITLNGTDGSSTHAGDNIILDASASVVDAGEKLLYEGIPPDEVSVSDLAAGTDGHIITYNASGYPTTVGPGTDGQVLTSTGAGSPPAFETAAAGGAWTLIGSATADNSASLTITGMDTTYRSFAVRMTNFQPASDNAEAKLHVGDSGGLQTESAYYVHAGKITSNTYTYDGFAGNPITSMVLTSYIGNNTGEIGGGTIFIGRTGNTVSFDGTIAFGHTSGGSVGGWVCALYKGGTFAMTQVRFTYGSGNITTGTMDLWGLSHA